MIIIADLHIHSAYSMSTSKDLTFDNIVKWAQIKGIDVLGTGDFSHPLWLKEIEEKLHETSEGLFVLKKNMPNKPVYFILSTEISCIYKKLHKTRRIHVIILFRKLSLVKKFNQFISSYGNLNSDGRLTVKLDVRDLLEIVLAIDSSALLIPAHVWTPYYSLFGSKTGFDSLEECFEDMSPYITTLETGLSSDIFMNRKISRLDNINFVSFSDAHSPSKIAREATILDVGGNHFDYHSVVQVLKTGHGLVDTIEIFPQEGKYYFDGHRDCNISMCPEESVNNNYICPVCRRPLTIGVLHRINKLADIKDEMKAMGIHIVPLIEIISLVTKKRPDNKKCWEIYFKMIERCGSEIDILLHCNLERLREFDLSIASAIENVRNGNLKIKPGYDGVYGKIEFPKGSIFPRFSD